jgi:hypothetical protein
MIRTIVIPEKNVLSFYIPDKYIGKKMEVIAFMVDEHYDDVIYATKNRKSFSAVKLKTIGFKFNRDEANER